MIKLRIIYSQELIALSSLFFLTEGRNINSTDYLLEKDIKFGGEWFNIISEVSIELKNLLQPFQNQTIWSPILVIGSARGFFSNHSKIAVNLAGISEIPKIPWKMTYGPIVFIDRNYYQTALEMINLSPIDWIYTGEMEIKRLITGDVPMQQPYTKIINIGIILDTYLYGWPFFIFPLTIDPIKLKQKIFENYWKTFSRRVPGGRKIQSFANIGYAVTLDSGDELLSLLSNQKINGSERLTFPPNPNLTGDDAAIWQMPVKVGNEDLSFELSYYRETSKIDPEYYQYRQEKIKTLSLSTKDYFLNK